MTDKPKIIVDEIIHKFDTKENSFFKAKLVAILFGSKVFLRVPIRLLSNFVSGLIIANPLSIKPCSVKEVYI